MSDSSSFDKRMQLMQYLVPKEELEALIRRIPLSTRFGKRRKVQKKKEVIIFVDPNQMVLDL